MINNPLEITPTPAEEAALATLFQDKASGVEMNTPKESLDRASEVIRHIVTCTLHGINAGLCGEPTQEDLQRAHVLKSLLEDLP